MFDAHLKTWLLIATMLYLTSLLEHEKSFLVHDAAAVVYSISVHKGSLLLTSSNDILEKDIVTGAIQRTFRAHTNLISAFVVTNDSRMITSASDDMIIIWSLESGAILKRIWLGSTGTLVKGLSLQGDQVYSGGDDGKIRHLDLVAGRVIRSRGTPLANWVKVCRFFRKSFKDNCKWRKCIRREMGFSRSIGKDRNFIVPTNYGVWRL